MNERMFLPIDFYVRQVTEVAQALLGKRLVRFVEGQVITGLITETEAYDGMQDLACHARVGKTKRNAVMFGKAGHAYVYFTYGMHWCLNVVTGQEGYPAAVLIRAIEPLQGLLFIAQNRANVDSKYWTNGPAKLTKALSINREQNGIDLTTHQGNLWIEEGLSISSDRIKTSPRIGISNTPEPWRSKPWRYFFEVDEEEKKGSQ